MPSHSLRQRRITEFVEVREYLWVPPRLRRDDLLRFAEVRKDKPVSKGGD